MMIVDLLMLDSTVPVDVPTEDSVSVTATMASVPVPVSTDKSTVPRRDRSKGMKQIRKALSEQKKVMKKLLDASEAQLIKSYQARCAPHGDPIDWEVLDKYSELHKSDPVNRHTENALASVPVDWLAEDRAYLQGLGYAYSNLLDICPRATHQASSGRCWLFAALNTMRYHIIRQFNLGDNFELSEAYLFFYDKVERSQYFLEKMLELRERPVHDPVIAGMCDDPICDGGTWGFFTNLILKYGMVPKTCYGESFNTLCTDSMNEMLHRKLSDYVHVIRSSKLSEKTLRRKIRDEFMPEIYSLMVKFMGEPPKTFDWAFHEKGETFESERDRGAYRCIPGLTPQTFYMEFIEPQARIRNKIVLRHDPREQSEYYRTFDVEHNGNMVGGRPDINLNVPWEVLSAAAVKALMNGDPVWFAADVCKDFNPERDLLAVESYDYEGALNTEFIRDKAAGLNNRLSIPSHAMALVGIDLVDGDPSKVRKWKVENSWGEFAGSIDPGYLLMTDAWFRQYGYEVVVDIDVLDEKTQEAFHRYEYDPIILPFNDPFGAVARSQRAYKFDTKMQAKFASESRTDPDPLRPRIPTFYR